jgi:hypothetical protein
MKAFTAIYDTQKYKGINYSFKAKSLKAAKQWVKEKFNFDVVSNMKVVADKN